MSNEQKFRTMMEMQIEMNDIAAPGWRERNLPWRDAIWTECAELLDHIGWKWWKKQEPDMEQARMELVDIWHFGMSLEMAGPGKLAETVNELAEYHVSRMSYLEKSPSWGMSHSTGLIRDIVEGAASCGYFSVSDFFRLMAVLDMTLDDLYSMYVGKNVLNKFRQANGYKEGTYIKDWGGVEDNVELAHIVRSIDLECPDFPVRVHQKLALRYSEVLTSASESEGRFGLGY